MVNGNSRNANARAASAGDAERPPSAKAQAQSTTKAGLTNSDGCTPAIQRREPFTSTPNASARTISAMLTTKTISAARRTWRGERKDVAIISAAAGATNAACRLTK